MELQQTKNCRLSGESLHDAELLFELDSCPLPGIYPDEPYISAGLRTPLRVIQSKKSGFVQLAHSFSSGMYSDYAFAGGGAVAYRKYLDWFAGCIADEFSVHAIILEVGCGDGYLIGRLLEAGFMNVMGIDPSRAAETAESSHLVRGFFPQDMPSAHQHKKYDLVICRHVLEHIEQPVKFMEDMASSLSPSGQLWIEVPDLDMTVQKGIWSNFYQLHCNYFNETTLDTLAALSGLRCIRCEIVDIFGGSILRRYTLSSGFEAKPVERLNHAAESVSNYRKKLEQLAAVLPADSVGYGAAERTAVILGLAPELEHAISVIYDGNHLLAGRYLAGTQLPIRHKEKLFETRPEAIVLFALSNSREILLEWKNRLPGNTLVALAGGDFALNSLSSYQ